MMQKWGVIHKFVSPYYLQAKHSKRTNRTLKTMIRYFLGEAHSAWDLLLQKFALRFDQTTQVTLTLLNLGREIPKFFDRQISRTDTQQFSQKLMLLNRYSLS